MKDIHHDHLVRFYGACITPSMIMFITEYCPKGSLQDILENEQFKLDWMFKFSLMQDIVRVSMKLCNKKQVTKTKTEILKGFETKENQKTVKTKKKFFFFLLFNYP